MKECIFGSLFVHLHKGYVLVGKEIRYLHLQQRQVIEREIETVATGDFSSFCVGNIHCVSEEIILQALVDSLLWVFLKLTLVI